MKNLFLVAILFACANLRLFAADAPPTTAAGAAQTQSNLQKVQQLLQNNGPNDPEAGAKKVLAQIAAEIQQLNAGVAAANEKALALPPAGTDAASILPHIAAEEAIVTAARQLSDYGRNLQTHVAEVIKKFNVPETDPIMIAFKASLAKGGEQLIAVYDAMQKAYSADADCLKILAANAGRWKQTGTKRIFEDPELQQKYDAAMKASLEAAKIFTELQAKFLTAQKAAVPAK